MTPTRKNYRKQELGMSSKTVNIICLFFVCFVFCFVYLDYLLFLLLFWW